MIEAASPQESPAARQIVIVTGLSGAGKTTVMRTLEDIGFYCVDNLPFPLVSTFLTLTFHSTPRFPKVALGIDARGEHFLSNIVAEISSIKKDMHTYDLKIIFVNAREGTILKRFQETRRRHPLADGKNLADAIEKERQIMEPIMSLADINVDTDILNIHELRNLIKHRFAHNQNHQLIVNLVSFGFKYGMPVESNLVYDVRFLPNPYFIPALKALDGTQEEIHNFLFTQAAVVEYWSHFIDFLRYSLEKFYQEGRFFVTVAIGCTGGKHRSVCFVEKINKTVWPHLRFLVTHRDLGKE